ncbi:MAG: hydrogenase maturation protease [Gemmatimonadetes bacterium]|uniref:Hydrogenase maturation protease n=1 Tax=Candidatus Kutchimonas denitrificans TaxID=3056748 RepID=A0AAE5C8S8_9BACT|nr:hydrogenase maturation protease [Gemmatimonadota bacterium]NIR74746.1 hydrogenase maturation protease [Candidatus Kutchimonas denitrificans]NIS01496.1 hydrogenase maturation protease [Gemmatimonadota bacterium]NIT67237.1 hydrogenase maturation protease [Gemmatimonadota bacterium]NIU52411.1 hydrogenase maturation protease [Gemmatimonadota bacterium]
MTASGNEASVLVLGLGNVLCGDDGLGVAAVERFRLRYRISEAVRALDGGTLGLALLSHIRSTDDVILVDAVGAAGPPGTFVRLEGDEVAPELQARLSCHQIGVADLLNALAVLDAYPRRLILLGLVPETLELGLALSPPIENRLAELVERIADEVRRLGHDLIPNRPEQSANARSGDRAARALGLSR